MTQKAGSGRVDRAGIAGEIGTDVLIVISGSCHGVSEVADDLIIGVLPVCEELVYCVAELSWISRLGRRIFAIVDNAFENLAFEVVDGGGDALHIWRPADFARDGRHAAHDRSVCWLEILKARQGTGHLRRIATAGRL